MPADPSAVGLERLTVRFPRAGRTALSGVDLELRPGERLLVLGPSGSGKSTLLRVLAGIVPQAVAAHVDGSTEVMGTDTTGLAIPELARRTGILTQNPLDQLCLPVVEDELAFPLENRGVEPEEIGATIRLAADRLGITHLLERRTATLSGGEGQRVALAAALVADPELLLLDEPTALLDPAGAARVSRAMTAGRARSLDRRRSMVLVEHRLDELHSLPERLLLLGPDGSVDEDGPTDEIFAGRGKELAAAGAWLPFETELGTMTGQSPENLTGLDSVLPPAAGAAGSSGPVLFRARSGTVDRDGRTVVDGVDLDLRAGEVTVVMGPNGSGKTTLLLGLAGMLPSRGMHGGSVGMVFQHPEHQFLTRSARAEVTYGADEPAADRILRRYGLDDVKGADPFRLSGGQQRRLSLAAVTALDRDVILADEPSFGQDRRTWRTVVNALSDLARSGKAVVVATHDLRLAARLADRMVVMADGRAVAAGPPDRILEAGDFLARQGLPLPPLLRWWRTTGVPARRLVAGLDALAE